MNLKKALSIPIFLIFFLSCGKPKTCEGIYQINNLTYKNGEPYSGICVTHNSNYGIRSIQSYYDGFDHGEWKFFFDNGNISTIGKFNEGEKIGVWKYFYENGAIKVKSEYSINGKLLKQEKYNIDGNLIKDN